ncbi:MAG: hypothetical protein M3Y12_07980, partial [Bacteroidota bacterium]|nr:hypothetical protein [Bacteroidota bacterium]
RTQLFAPLLAAQNRPGWRIDSKGEAFAPRQVSLRPELLVRGSSLRSLPVSAPQQAAVRRAKSIG